MPSGAYSLAQEVDVGWRRKWQGHYEKCVVPWADLPVASRHMGPQPAAIPLEREEERELSKPDEGPFLYDRDLAPSDRSVNSYFLSGPSLVT